MGVEGCLSIPGLIGEVERHEAIQVKGAEPLRQAVKSQSGWLDGAHLPARN